jgi:hypothetical protein
VLLSPPSVALSGEAPVDAAEELYVIGSTVAGALPEHVLLNSLRDDYVRTLISAIRAAFGPVAPAPDNSAIARLAQDLWQFVGPRLERRMRQICSMPEQPSYEAMAANTRQAMRRAGLYASGSLSTAIARTIRELSLDLDAPLTDEDGLARACLRHPPVADLFRLAIRVEYAEARWQGVSPSERPEVKNGRVSAG